MPVPDFVRDGSSRQRKAFAELRQLLKTPGSDPSRYLAIGKHVQVLLPRWAESRYGHMQALAQSLGGEKSLEATLHGARQVFHCFGKRRLRDLAGLSWTHLRLLAMVPERADREEMLEQCRAEKWTTSELLVRIQAKYGKRSKAGRRLASREHYEPAMVLREVVRATDQWLTHYPAWFGDSRQCLAKLPRGQTTTALKLDIELARQRLEQLGQSVKTAEQILRRLAGRRRSKAGSKATARRSTKKAASRRR